MTTANNPVPNFYRASSKDFKKIPGSPIAYWVSEKFVNPFTVAKEFIHDLTISDGQTKTGDNDRFLRQHWEISSKKVGINGKWWQHPKGGPYRKWYGNVDWVIDWSDDARRHYRKDRVARILPEYLWGEKGISWTLITSGEISFRILERNQIFNLAAPSLFFRDENNIEMCLGFLNTKYVLKILKVINPTLNMNVGEVRCLPLLDSIDSVKVEIKKIVDECLFLAKSDWDSYETSLDFKTLPLLSPKYKSPTIKETYAKLQSHWQKMALETQKLEEENNRIFIEAYGLEDELTPDIPLSDITLTCNPHYRYGGNKSKEELEALLLKDTIKELISYAVGCMFGRYSLDKTGLILANQGETRKDYLEQIPEPTFMPDEDNILPILDDEYFSDDIVSRFKDFLKITFGKETLATNLEFIAKALTGRSTGSPEKAIRDYFIKQFYKDHVQTYKKRPIYWMFSSGKNQGFNALIYMHRYDKSTLAKMRTDYLLELESKLIAEVEMLSQDTTQNKARLTKIKNQIEEMKKYDELLNNKALSLIEIDLDDGVKVNYAKFEGLVKGI